MKITFLGLMNKTGGWKDFSLTGKSFCFRIAVDLENFHSVL
jgi:hypothetical protein